MTVFCAPSPFPTYEGTAKELITAGIATKKMLQIPETDNGFCVCDDEFGTECSVMDMVYIGSPGRFRITKYGESPISADSDISGIMDGLSKTD